MSAFIQQWRTVFLTLLLGVIAATVSKSALADVATDYVTLNCAICHGTPPALNAGSFPFTPAKLNSDYPTNKALEAYIDASMPLGTPSSCDAACAQRMTHYLRPQAPVADASKSTKSGTAPFNAQFDASLSYCDNGCSKYVWSFGDGKPNGSGVTTSHSYASAGNYPVTLTVTDAQGLTKSTTLTVTVTATAKPPVANASKSSNLSGVAPLNAKFDASLSSCPNGCTKFNSYYWAVPSGPTLSGVTASYTFKEVGTHVVTLTVTDDQGLKSTAKINVTVTASSKAPIANASKSPNVKGAVPLNALFDATLSSCDNNCSSYAWNFGDGSPVLTGMSTTPNHTYTTVGNYTVTLTVTDKGNGKKTSTTVQVKVVPAESLSSYVQACQTQLNFQNVSIPNMDCYDGDLFDDNNPARDFLGYKKITDQVDVTFACRWLSGDKKSRGTAVSLELIVHNRQNGNTCFFSAKHLPPDKGIAVPSLITSPTDAAASSYWEPPAVVDAGVRCVGCHISGPYIATPLIAPFLAKYGLMNDGHDTLHNVTTTNLNPTIKYHAISALVNGVPGAFSEWDSLKQSYIDPALDKTGCSQGCHVVGTLSPQSTIVIAPAGTVLANPLDELQKINGAGVMKPYDDWSDYRWINLDNASDGVEKETFEAANNATTTLVPKLFSSENPNCAQPNVPNVMEAHVVGGDNHFVVAQPGRFAFLADRLSVFNLKQGLVCLNADQDPGQKCQDYRVRYECTDATGKKTWTGYFNQALKSDGDHEERPGSVCPAGSTATSIEAAFTHPANGWTYGSVGPNDKLASFSQYGLTCNTADQPDGQCSNYVVRYSSCSAPPATLSNKTLTNVFAVGKQLTAATGSLAKGQAHNNSWNTQAWTIELVKNTEYVRLKNPGTNVYLNVSSAAESATVGTATSNTSTNQMWLVETVLNSTDVRLKNVFSGKYLTIADPASYPSTPDYLPIFSQSRNTAWTSQRWALQ